VTGETLLHSTQPFVPLLQTPFTLFPFLVLVLTIRIR